MSAQHDEGRQMVAYRKQSSILSISDILANGSHSDFHNIGGSSKRADKVITRRTSVESTLEKQTFCGNELARVSVTSESKSHSNEHANNAEPLGNGAAGISCLSLSHRKVHQQNLTSIRNINYCDRLISERPEILDLATTQSRLLWEAAFWQRRQLLARLEWSNAFMDRAWTDMNFQRAQTSPISHQPPHASSTSTSANGMRHPRDCSLEYPKDHVFLKTMPSFFHSGKTDTVSNYNRPTRSVVGSRPRRHRQAYTVAQLNILEDEFKVSHYLRLERREMLSQTLGLTENQVKAWFQNRRTKYKKQRTIQQTDDFGQTETRSATDHQHKPCLTDTTNSNTFLYSLLHHSTP